MEIKEINNPDISRSRITNIMRIFVILIGLFWFGALVSRAATTFYVTTNGAGNLSGSDWANATNNIQGAIDAIETGAANTVWVSNGVYEVGGVTNYPSGTVLTNRIAIWKAITVRSANNDPANTIIKGAMGNDTNGPLSVRCVYMTNGSALIGFMLTNGATLHLNYPATGTNENHNGGGVWCESTNTVISNCMLVGNMAAYSGGGAYKGTMYNCTLCTNTMFAPSMQQTLGAGASQSTLYNCILTRNWSKSGNLYGGGAYGSTLYNCTLSSNSAITGGGAYNGNLYNCLIIGNSATAYGGGGARLNFGGALYNCTITRNTASGAGGGGFFNSGAGSAGTLVNCIVWGNTHTTSSNISITGAATLSYCCSGPVSNGVGNIGSDPQFVDKDTDNYRLKNISPCINAGTNGSWTTSSPYDLDARARNRYGTVDMGAYERIHNGTVCGVH